MNGDGGVLEEAISQTVRCCLGLLSAGYQDKSIGGFVVGVRIRLDLRGS
jgi:hypothetical protein